jgi:hypothetical protein
VKALVHLLAAVAVTLVATTTLAAPALAHGGEEDLVIEPRTASPGGPVSVRGDLPTTSSISLVLVGSHGKRLRLASVDDPAEGHFEVVVTIPAGVPPGTWRLQAFAGGSLLAEDEIGVLAVGVPKNEGAQPDQAEPVAAASGATPPAVRPDAATLAASPLRDPSTSSTWEWVAVVAGVVTVLVTAAAVTAAAAKRRRPQPTRDCPSPAPTAYDAARAAD